MSSGALLATRTVAEIDPPLVHVEQDIAFPQWQQRMSLVHINPNSTFPDRPFVHTGCEQNVLAKDVSGNPHKVTCTQCREYAAVLHGKLARVYNTALGLARKQDPILLRQLKGLRDHHEAHSRAFSDPL